MKEPRRLNRSGGASQRLLASASLDRPGQAARRHVASLAATASSFAHTSSNVSGTSPRARRANPAKTLAIWMTVGAAASVALGFLGSSLLGSDPNRSAATPLATLSAAAPPVATVSPEIAPEPPVAPHPVDPRSAPNAAPAEATALDAARTALSSGDTAAAIAHLDRYESAHPNGQLKPEALALRIQALRTSGHTIEARRLANDFQAKYPQHPLAAQVRGEVAK